MNCERLEEKSVNLCFGRGLQGPTSGVTERVEARRVPKGSPHSLHLPANVSSSFVYEGHSFPEVKSHPPLTTSPEEAHKHQ